MRTTRPLATRVLGSLLTTALLLTVTGCGSDSGGSESTGPYLLTDLEGGTAPVPSEEGASIGSSDTIGAGASPATGSPGATDAPPTTAALVEQIGAAISGSETVHVSGGDDSPVPVLESDHLFGSDRDDFGATLTLVPGQPVEVRRLDDVLYVDAGAGWQVVDAGALDGVPAAGLVPALGEWNPLSDLRDVLLGADDLTEAGPDEIAGVPVTSYRFTLDTSAVSQPSMILPDAAPAAAEVTVSLDSDDLPVRVDLDLGSRVSRIGYSDWGAPVDLAVPDVA